MTESKSQHFGLTGVVSFIERNLIMTTIGVFTGIYDALSSIKSIINQIGDQKTFDLLTAISNFESSNFRGPAVCCSSAIRLVFFGS